MQEEVANVVYPVLDHALEVHRRLLRGEAPELAAEQAALERLLGAEAESGRYSDLSAGLEIRYALACWLDERFILDSPWSRAWNERKLEVALFNSNDRAWRFWEKARRALSRSEPDVLEVYYLAVMLGFRGELRDRPEELRSWAAAARTQLARTQDRSWSAPPDLDPPTRVPPLRGRDRLRGAVLRLGVALLLAVPVFTYFIARQLRG